jgi:hypothetical protein
VPKCGKACCLVVSITPFGGFVKGFWDKKVVGLPRDRGLPEGDDEKIWIKTNMNPSSATGTPFVEVATAYRVYWKSGRTNV